MAARDSFSIVFGAAADSMSRYTPARPTRTNVFRRQPRRKSVAAV